MGRYRKTDPRMYGDEKFRRLSRPKPNGQTLFHYLFTGPHTTSLPGLYCAGEAGLAEALGWPLKGFRAAWASVCAAGLAQADWKARVIWLPNVIRYDPPESPSVVKSWVNHFNEIPECRLKRQAYEHLRAWLAGCGTAWLSAWPSEEAQGVPHPYPDPEPEPEPTLSCATQAVAPARKRRSQNGEYTPGFEALWKVTPDPVRVGKGAAFEVWTAYRLEERAEEVTKAMDRTVKTDSWKRNAQGEPCYPNLRTWLHQRRFDDGSGEAANRKAAPYLGKPEGEW